MSYINSPFFGFPNEIRSIRHALSLLGSKEARKWLSLIALSSMGRDKSEELVLSSLFRANMCEAVAVILAKEEDKSDLFLIGLFSMIDAFLDRPMREIMAELPLSDAIKQALLGLPGPLTDIFGVVVAYERGDWERTYQYLAQFDCDGSDLPLLFSQTVDVCNRLLPV
jgi:EAL and modified HD-GYP domain-containing signal transduction protein